MGSDSAGFLRLEACILRNKNMLQDVPGTTTNEPATTRPSWHFPVFVWKETKRRHSDVGCRVPQVWGQEKDVFLPRLHGFLNARKENKQHSSDFGYPLEGEQKKSLRCLEFGVRKKTSFCLGHMGLLTRGRRGCLELWGKEKDGFSSVIWGWLSTRIQTTPL